MFQMVVHRIKPRLHRCFSLHINNGCLKAKNKFNSTVDKKNVEDKFINNEPESEILRGNSQVIKELKATQYADLHLIPYKALKKSVNITNLHLIDKDAAEKFASMIIPDIPEKNSLILEINPGLCYVTEKLLPRCNCPIYLFEKDSDFLTHIETIVTKYSDRLKIMPKNLLTLPSKEYKDIIQNNDITNGLVEDIKHKYSNDSIYIIGAVSKVDFLYLLRYSLMSGCLSTHKYATLYLAILPSMLQIFCDTTKFPTYCTANNIILQMLFKHEILGELPRRAFLPWPSEQSNQKLIKKYGDNDNVMHAVKLVLNQDFLNSDLMTENLEHFFLFLFILLRRRNSCVIPILEQWVPNCGPRLIALNYNIFTRFSELSAQQLFELFKTFASWPEYKSCIFQDIVDEAIARKVEGSKR